MRGGVLVCGTSSDAGKSFVVAGLCRLLARRGVKVAPFKAQNMALNSFVTPSGHEIGRAQGAQALAAGIEPEVAMNPVLLKPTGDRSAQVVLLGAPVDELDAAAYEAMKPRLFDTVLGCLADLRTRFDVVIAEGAGSPAEINLLDGDIVNLPLAAAAGLPVLVVGDIDRGGVFASLFGTVALLPPDLRRLVRAFLLNKFRGDPALLGDGPAELERRTGVPTIGVVPMVRGVMVDAEDSLALQNRWEVAPAGGGDVLDVAVVSLPRLSNFTDVDPLRLEPQVAVRFVSHATELGGADLVIVPGTKSTVADLAWLRARGFPEAIAARRRAGATVLGICGGYQMLGGRIVDHVESGAGEVEGLGWLDVTTVFEAAKCTRRRRGSALGAAISGYEIHHGRPERGPGATPWIACADGYGEEDEGAVDAEGAVRGTSLHGVFEADGFRRRFLTEVAWRRGKDVVLSERSFAEHRLAQFDRVADVIEAHVDQSALGALIEAGARSRE